MENKNHPNWLVPLEIARKLKEIGMTNSEILIRNDGTSCWYSNEEMYDYDNNGELIIYTALDASKWENPNLEPTYTWEQVFEWFREKEIVGTVKYLPILGKKIYIYVINAPFVSCKEEFLSYEEAREALVNRLIKEYTEYEQAKKEWEAFHCDCCN